MQLYKTCFIQGPVAEWLGKALQKLLHQFESGRDLQKSSTPLFMRGLFIMRIPKILYWAGITAAVLLIGCCFMPWTFYPDINKTFTGFFSEQNEYGKPAVFLITIAIGSLIFTMLPQLWAKRTNMFWCALGVGYAIKTYILYTSSYGAFSPEKRTGIYLMLFSSLIMLIASLFPDVEMKESEK